MAGVTTPEMVAHASNAGAVGSLPCAYLSPDQMTEAIAKTNLLTTRPFAVNLFLPSPVPRVSKDRIQAALEVTAPYRDEMSIEAPSLLPPFLPNFEAQFEVLLRTSPTLFSFVFGVLDREHMQACRDRGIATVGTATTLEEALELEESGVNYICLQGTEAGGHRAIFEPEQDEPGVSMKDLLESAASKLKTPLIAAGGIMTGQEIVRALKLGAQAVQMGTAFLLADEAATSKPYRDVLLNRSAGPELTRVFTGRLARGIPTRFQTEMKASPHAILPFPMQHALTRPLRAKSETIGSSQFISAWAGQNVAEIRNGFSTVSLIHELEREGLASLGLGSR